MNGDTIQDTKNANIYSKYKSIMFLGVIMFFIGMIVFLYVPSTDGSRNLNEPTRFLTFKFLDPKRNRKL